MSNAADKMTYCVYILREFTGEWEFSNNDYNLTLEQAKMRHAQLTTAGYTAEIRNEAFRYRTLPTLPVDGGLFE